MSGAFGEVDIDLLADYIGGVLEGTPDEAAVAELIASDEQWREAHAALGGSMERVGAELAALGPEPMPADVAERLDALFSSPPAVVFDDVSPVQGRHVPDGSVRAGIGVGPRAAGERDVVPEKGQRNRGPGRADGARRRRWVTPVALAVGVIAFVGFGLDYLATQSGSSGTSASTSASGAKVPAAAPDTLTVTASGTNYTAATLGETVRRPDTARGSAMASAQGTMPFSGSAAPTPATGLRALSARDALLACLQAIQAENGAGMITTDSVDYASYDGSPAVIVRFHAANGSWAWAAGAACGSSGGGADSLGKVRLR